MDKINLGENLDKGLKVDEIIKNFFTQILRESYKKDWNERMIEPSVWESIVQNRLDRIVIKERSVDSRMVTIYVYADCEQEVINKLLSFDEEYVSYEKYIKKVNKLKRHHSMKFEVYKITYDEYRKIEFCIVKNNAGSNYVKDILVAEDDLEFAKENLDCIDVKL